MVILFQGGELGCVYQKGKVGKVGRKDIRGKLLLKNLIN